LKIKITQCSIDESWYKDRIGKVFDVLNDGPGCVEVGVCKKKHKNVHFFVRSEDYIIIKERKKGNFHAKSILFNGNRFRGGSLGYDIREFENVYDDRGWNPS